MFSMLYFMAVIFYEWRTLRNEYKRESNKFTKHIKNQILWPNQTLEKNRPLGKESTEIQITQNKGKERENSVL